jgi:colicin import membrane protein
MVWMRRAKVHVTRAWVLAPGFRTQPLSTEIRVRLNAGGQVLGTRVVRRSGNPWFDESVERAIKKASPLPPPPEADEWLFVFRPEDVL